MDGRRGKKILFRITKVSKRRNKNCTVTELVEVCEGRLGEAKYAKPSSFSTADFLFKKSISYQILQEHRWRAVGSQK